MADKFLETAEMKQLKEELKLTKPGQILYEEWRAEGIATGRAEEVEESIETVIAFIQELSNSTQEGI